MDQARREHGGFHGRELEHVLEGFPREELFQSTAAELYRNLAEDWQDWVATAGVGLDLFGFRIDVGGAYSLEGNVDYEGTEIPAEARLYASLGLDF